jgi:nitrogen fixation NifU-like protein
MSDLTDLYQEVILDHNKRPRNFGTLEGASHHAEGHNPLCGDRIAVEVDVRDGRLESVGFTGAGCAISTASASMMTEAVAGRGLPEIESLAQRFRDALTGPAGASAGEEELGKLVALTGVREYPMRVKCATLAWHALRAALAGGGRVSTE